MTTLPSVADGRTVTSGAPSERATPATVRRCGEALKSSSARAIFSPAFVGTAWTERWSRGGTVSGSRLRRPRSRRADRRRGRRLHGDGDGLARARAPRRRRPRRAPRSVAVVEAREVVAGLGRRALVAPARAQAGQERPAVPLAAAADRASSSALADPALVRRARRCTARRPSRRDPECRKTSACSPRSSVRPQTSQETTGPLVVDRLARHDGVEDNEPGPVRRLRRGRPRRPAAARPRPSARGGPGPPRSAATPSCSRPGRR